MVAKQTETKTIKLPPLDIRTIHIKLIGDTSLISHAWSQKAKQMMLDKQMGNAQQAKEPKDPEQDFKDSLYNIPGGGYGFPAIGFKAAAVTACTSVGGVTKVEARQAFHINSPHGEYVRIDGEPTPREDMVRVGMGTADIRFRAEFLEWSAILPIRYNHRVLTDSEIVNLFNVAGFGVGIGDWRSEKDGMHGLFHVASGEEDKKGKKK